MSYYDDIDTVKANLQEAEKHLRHAWIGIYVALGTVTLNIVLLILSIFGAF